MERKDREGTNRTEALLQAFRQRMGDGYQIEPSEGDRKDVIFKIIKDGEQEGIILYPNAKKIQFYLLCRGAEKTAAILEQDYQKKREQLGAAFLNGSELSMVKDKIVFSLVSRKEYQEALPYIPYKTFHEMVIVFQIVIQDGKERYVRMINNEDMESWGITVEELLEVAQYNTPRLEFLYVIKLRDEDGVWNVFHQEWHEELFYAGRKLRRTAKSIFPVIGLFGERSAANCILYPGVLGFVANRWNEDVMMILGTEMECYLFPEHFYLENPQIVERIAEQIWKSNVEERPFLTDYVYRYRWNEEKLEQTEQRIPWEKFPLG